MLKSVAAYCNACCKNFNTIPAHRKEILNSIVNAIKGLLAKESNASIVFICTHNSRRSHFGQIWAQVAAHYFNVPHIKSFSGGTEVTAVSKNIITALKNVGFETEVLDTSSNPPIQITYDHSKTAITCYSKQINDYENPQSEFIAIVMCAEADRECPIVLGANSRIALPFDDPKAADNTALQDSAYGETCKQVAMELLYVFKNVSQ